MNRIGVMCLRLIVPPTPPSVRLIVSRAEVERPRRQKSIIRWEPTATIGLRSGVGSPTPTLLLPQMPLPPQPPLPRRSLLTLLMRPRTTVSCLFRRYWRPTALLTPFSACRARRVRRLSAPSPAGRWSRSGVSGPHPDGPSARRPKRFSGRDHHGRGRAFGESAANSTTIVLVPAARGARACVRGGLVLVRL